MVAAVVFVVFVERWRLVRVGNAFAPTATANHPRALRLLLFAAQRWFRLESTTVAIAPHEEVVVVRLGNLFPFLLVVLLIRGWRRRRRRRELAVVSIGIVVLAYHILVR